MRTIIIRFLIKLLKGGNTDCLQGKHRWVITRPGIKNGGIEEGYCEVCNVNYWKNILL